MLSRFIIFFKNVVYSWMYKRKSGKTISVEIVLLGSPSGVLGHVFQSRRELFFGPTLKENPCLILKRWTVQLVFPCCSKAFCPG